MTQGNEAQTGGAVAAWLGRTFMRLAGWRVVGQAPDCTKLVIVAAPHTSNWDFVYLLAAAFDLRLRIHWLGKASLFCWPLGAIMNRLGGIPVDRSRAGNLVKELTDRFSADRQLAIVIPPSGTRGETAYWKSGFYWTALEAGATVVCGYLDYPNRTAGLGHSFSPTGDVSADMDAVRAFYDGIEGKYPRHASVPRLKEEDA